MSTQGLTSAQIQQSLAARLNAEGQQALTTAQQYEAMVNAGLLRSKQALTVAQIQENLQTVLGAEADAGAALASMGLTTSTNAQGIAVATLSAKKIEEAVATGILTKTQAEELAMRLGVTAATKAQAGTILPNWIASLKNSASAISLVAKETAIWLATTPAGWAIAAVAALGIVITGYKAYQKKVEEAREATILAADEYTQSAEAIESYARKYQELQQALTDAGDDEAKIYEVKKELLDLQEELNRKFGDEYEKINLVTDAYYDQTEAIKKYAATAASEFLNDPDNQDSIRRANKKMEAQKTYVLSPTILYNSSETHDALKEIAQQFEDQGIQIRENLSSGIFSIRTEKLDALQAYKVIGEFETAVRKKAKELGDEQLFDGILDISGTSYTKAKDTVEKWGDLYRKGITAKINEDNDLSAQMDAAKAAVEKYNDAILKTSNPFDDQNVATARQELRQLKTEMQDSDGSWNDPWKKYGTVIDEVFNKADTRLYDFGKKLGYDPQLRSYINELKGLTDTEVEAMGNDGDNNDAFDKLFNDAKKYGLGLKEVINLLIRLDLIQEQVSSSSEELKPFSKSEMISEINKLSEGFESLDKIMTSIKKKDTTFDYALIDDTKFKENFGDYTEEYDNFIETVTKSPKDIKACQSAFDDLATAYIYSSDIMKGLSDETADVATQYLELMGVANASEVVASTLAQQHAEAALATRDLTNMTAEEIDALARESEATEAAANSFKLYAAEKFVAELAIDPTGDINALANIVDSLGLATNAWREYNAARNVLTQMESTKRVKNGRTYYSYQTVENGKTVEHLATEDEYNALFSKSQNSIKEFGEDLKENTLNYQPVRYNGPKSSNPSKSSNSKKEKKDPTTFDWMERRIKDLDSQIDNLKTNIDTLVGYEGKNRATDSAIDLMRIKLEDLGKMYDAYMEKANSFGLSEEYAVKVREGTISIEEIDPNNKANEALIEQIKNYQEWYEKAIDCKDQITETTEAVKTLNLSKLDNIIDQFDTLVDVQSQIIDTEQQLLDLREKQGETIEADDYISLAEKQLESTRLNIEAYNRLSAEMAKLNLERGTEEWKKYNDQLQDLKNNMISAADAVEDYKDAMTALVYKDLNDFKNRMDSINGTIDTMSNLIGNTNLVDDDGLLTDRGLAQMALYAQQLSNARQEAAEYDEAIRSLDDAYDSGLITQDEYNSMLYEYKSAQESAVSATKAARDAILALVKEGIQAEIDAKKKLVDETKAALDAERDLHEYQQSIADKQGNISKLQRQIAALSNSTDRKDIAQKLQLQQQLADAQKDLFETQYDHELEQRKEALDKEYESFEESKNKEMDELDSNLDKQEGAINKYLEEVKKNHSTAYEILKQYGEEYNLTATDDLTNPWKSAGSAADLCSDAIGNVTANIQYEIDNLDFDSLYELIDLLNTIGEYGYGDGDATASQWEDISGTGKWHKSEQSGRWWYGSDEDNYASGGIYTINGKQYGFNDKGQMVTGWRNDIGDGTWRYFEPENGQMVRSTWRKSKTGEWYYLDKNGAMATNMAIKAKNEDGYYYVDEDGKMEEGLLSYEDVKRLGYKIGYKGGTRSATAGWHRIDEEGIGSETIITKDGQVLHPFRGDETVFSKANTNVLWEFTNNPSGFINGAIKNEPRANVEPVSQNVSVEMNIGGVLDEAAARVLSEQFPAMIKKNIKNISDGVANQVKWQLKGR